MNKSEKTKQFIVEKTAVIFNKKGFAGTSLSDLTTATGLTKGSIYGNFANKDEVALAAFDYNLSKMMDGMIASAADEENSVAKLLAMTAFHQARYKQVKMQGGCPLLNAAVDADDTHADLKERAAKGIKTWKRNVEKIVRQGIAKGEIKGTVDAAAFAAEYIALVEGGILLAKATGDAALLATTIGRLQKIITTELQSK